MASEEKLKSKLRTNLLIVGSPAVSLASREVLRRTGGTFLFNFGEGSYTHEKNVFDSKDLPEGQWLDESVLNQFFEREETKNDIDELFAELRKTGFVDPVDFKSIRGRAIPRDKDYGVIALAPNPWSPDHLACLCAGVHGGGTAGALQMLSSPKEFASRPWGGVFVVNLPDQAPWEDRFGYLSPRWETHEYDPPRYQRELAEMIEGIAKERFQAVQVSPKCLKQVGEFTKRLAAGHAGPFLSEEDSEKK